MKDFLKDCFLIVSQRKFLSSKSNPRLWKKRTFLENYSNVQRIFFQLPFLHNDLQLSSSSESLSEKVFLIGKLEYWFKQKKKKRKKDKISRSLQSEIFSHFIFLFLHRITPFGFFSKENLFAGAQNQRRKFFLR